MDKIENYQMSHGLRVNSNPENLSGMSETSVVWPIPTWSHPDSYNFFVLSWLLGNSSSFVSGGPGRGMHSRAPQSKKRFFEKNIL